jgi:MerR family transcriptional regulator, copper efflux regulator
MASSQQGVMHIGEVADRTRLSHRTIRYYDETGLLPAGRTEGGFREYTEVDVERLLLIRTLKPLGFALEEMRDVLDLLDAESPGPDLVSDLIERVQERRERLAQSLADADALLARLGLLGARGGGA